MILRRESRIGGRELGPWIDEVNCDVVVGKKLEARRQACVKRVSRAGIQYFSMPRSPRCPL